MLKTLYLILSTSLFFLSCNSAENSENFPPGNRSNRSATSVEVSSIERSEISRQIRSFGTIRAQDIVSINPQISETVIEIRADLGDTVAAGQVIARLNDVNYRDQLRSTQSELRQREITMERDSIAYGRQVELFERQLISPSEHEEVRAVYLSSVAAYEATQSALTQSAENLRRTEIRSPVHGVIKERFVTEGDLASSGQAMFDIANLAGYETRLFLPLRDWRETRVGQLVDIRNSGDQEFTSEGVITRKSPDIDEVTGLGQVVVSIAETGGELFSGSLTESRIYIETRENTIVIPRIALIENVQTVIDPESNSIKLERTYSAFVVQGDTLAQRRELELGIEQGDRIEVLNGLEPGEQIIITGQAGLENQAAVRPTSLRQNLNNGSGESLSIEGEELDSGNNSGQ